MKIDEMTEFKQYTYTKIVIRVEGGVQPELVLIITTNGMKKELA